MSRYGERDLTVVGMHHETIHVDIANQHRCLQQLTPCLTLVLWFFIWGF